MAAHKGLTLDNVREALEKGAGVHEGAARLLGVSRQAIRGWVLEYPELQIVIDATKQRITDIAEINMVTAINSGDRKWSAWWLDRQGKDRGFSPRLESTGPDGGPIAVTSRIHVTYDYVQPQPLPDLEPERPA